MTHPMVLAHAEDGVLTLTLNRPDKRNALHPELVQSLSELITEAADDESIAVIVITGSGGAFCAGLDIDLLAAWSSVERMEYLDSAIAMLRNIWDAPQPTIAAVDGPAIAGGFDLAAFCDIRLASPDAFFGQAEINMGLVQIVHPLYKTIGLGRAKELALTGANISADEAYRIGLVNHVYPAAELLERAHAMAAVMASKPRFALFETKRLTRELIDLDTAEALEQVEQSFCRCLNTHEHHERVARFLERHRR